MAPPIYALVPFLPERNPGAAGGTRLYRKNKLLQPCNKAAGAFPLLYNNSCLSVLDAQGHRSRFCDLVGLHGRKFRLDSPYSSI